jgi:hypothetical protein
MAARLGRRRLRLGEAAGVEAAGRIDQLIERRPPRPVLQRPERVQQAGGLAGAVGDPANGDPTRARRAQRAQIQVRAGTFRLRPGHDQVVVGQLESLVRQAASASAARSSNPAAAPGPPATSHMPRHAAATSASGSSGTIT